MRVSCPGIVDGEFAGRFGSGGTVFVNTMPGLSPPLEIADAPEGTVTFALVMDDYDAIPVCGFNWIHWTACDIRSTSIPEGASHNDPGFTEGCNSWCSALDELTVEEATGYGGPAPPDRPHRYTLTVYALDTELGLERGFRLNELRFAMEGHVLAQSTVIGTYRPSGQ